jgi:hypothetical protein
VFRDRSPIYCFSRLACGGDESWLALGLFVVISCGELSGEVPGVESHVGWGCGPIFVAPFCCSYFPGLKVGQLSFCFLD